MRSFRKVTTLLMAVLVLLSLAACSKDKRADESGENNQSSVNTSSEIYEFTVDLLGDTYTLPADLDEFKDNGWTYADHDDPEGEDVIANTFATCEIIKDGKEITLTVINMSTSTKKFADCKVGSINCTFSADNDITVDLARGLKVNRDTTEEDVSGKFGEATTEVNNDGKTTLRYTKELHVYYEFNFSTEGRLTSVDIRNWGNDEEISDNETIDKEADLSFLNTYETPDALTDTYADYIFRLEGNLYQLPAPVSSFVDNGWTIITQPDSIPGGNEKSGGLIMQKNDYELTFTVQNFADDPIETKDAMITGVLVNNSLKSKLLDGIDFEFSGGIFLGMNESDFKAKPYAGQFTSKNLATGEIKYSYFEPSNQMYLTFEDGKLVHGSFSKNTLNE